MLRVLKLLPRPAPLALMLSSIVAVIAITLFAVGLRPPGGDLLQTASAADLEAKYVPANALAVAVFRPTEFATLYTKANDSTTRPLDPTEKKNLEVMAKCNLAVAVTLQHAPSQPEPLAIALTFADKQSRDDAAKLLSPRATYQKEKLFLAEYEVSGNSARYQPDETTLIVGGRLVVEQMIATGPTSQSPLTQTDAWKTAAKQSIAIAINGASLKELASQMSADPVSDLLSPLWTASENHTIGIALGDAVTLVLTSTSHDEKSAKQVEGTLSSGIAMLTRLIAMLKVFNESPEQTNAVEALEGMLGDHELNRKGNVVSLMLTGDAARQSSVFFAILAPVIGRSRVDVQRVRQRYNMQQIMLALHNYHAVHKYFPPAVLIDEESGIPRSWRVEILPFIHAALLYEEYRKNEPWDSEANQKVLAQMPSIFRCPADPDDSTNSSIFAVYGKGLFFELDNNERIGLRNIIDGTGNTIAIVEANRNISWTKPEDILIDIDADEFPEFGCYADAFTVGLCDGRVKLIKKTIDHSILKKLFTRAGGELIDEF